MKRGDLYVAAERGELTAKPRPVLIVQADAANLAHSTIPVCLISATLTTLDRFRIAIDPLPGNGLDRRSEVQADRLFSLKRASLVQRLGALSSEDMDRVDAALRRWLAL